MLMFCVSRHAYHLFQDIGLYIPPLSNKDKHKVDNTDTFVQRRQRGLQLFCESVMRNPCVVGRRMGGAEHVGCGFVIDGHFLVLGTAPAGVSRVPGPITGKSALSPAVEIPVSARDAVGPQRPRWKIDFLLLQTAKID